MMNNLFSDQQESKKMICKIKRLETIVMQQKKKIQNLEREKKSLHSKNHQKSVVTSVLRKYFSPSQTKSILTQKRVCWSEEDIVKGLMLRCLSKKTYQFIRKKKLFPVPSISTLRKWVSKLDCSPGVLTDVLVILKKQISADANEKLKLGVFCFDEMDLSKKCEYFQAHDCVLGPSKKVQVGMVRGLCGDWKQPVFFDFDCPMKENLLCDILLQIEKSGIEIWAVTCDSGPSNQAALRKLGITKENTSFPNPLDPNRQIFVFLDVPHLLKLIRNHALDEGIFLGGTATKITRQDFQGVLDANKPGEFKIHHKLTSTHINCAGIQRQRVRLASQLLSHTSAVAMKILSPEKTLQSDFVELVNNWFDVLNSRVKFSKNKLNCGFGVHFEEQSAVLHKMIQTAETMKCDSKMKSVPFQRGIVISSKSLLSLFDELKTKRGVEFILTSHLNQDCLENFFSRVRAIGVTYVHPTSVEFVHRIRNLIVGKASEIFVATASVEMMTEIDDCQSLNGQSGFLSQKLTETIEDCSEP